METNKGKEDLVFRIGGDEFLLCFCKQKQRRNRKNYGKY